MSSSVLSRAAPLFEAGDLDGAARLLDEALREGFDPSAAALALGVHLYRDDAASAAAAVDALVREDPQLARAGLKETVSAYALYQKRRTDAAATNQRQGVGLPERWQLSRVGAAVHHARGEHARAKELLAESEPPPVAGTLVRASGAELAFESLTDSDDLAGPSLVCFRKGVVLDVPFHEIAKLELLERATLFDSALAPAVLALHDGRKTVVRLPARYPGSGTHPIAEVRLGRMTVWDHDSGYAIAHGLVDLRAGDAIVGLTSVRSITFT
jgi:protein involved in temperature-dependent protein secretion